MFKRIWSFVRNPFQDQQDWEHFRVVVPALLLASLLAGQKG